MQYFDEIGVLFADVRTVAHNHGKTTAPRAASVDVDSDQCPADVPPELSST